MLLSDILLSSAKPIDQERPENSFKIKKSYDKLYPGAELEPTVKTASRLLLTKMKTTLIQTDK